MAILQHISEWQGPPPQRIVSLVPSQTEWLSTLGLEEQVVGITKFCVHPYRWFRSKPRVGGTKQVHADRVHSLCPDLILANREENVREQVEELAERYPVWVTDVHDLESACAMMLETGTLCGRRDRAEHIVAEVRLALARTPVLHRPVNVLYLIWKDPYMAAGGDTFIHSMLSHCGFRNLLGAVNRYPRLTETEIIDLQPDAILLSSEPYPFAERHAAEWRQKCPGTRVELVDGEMFSWYGSRLLEAARYLECWLPAWQESRGS